MITDSLSIASIAMVLFVIILIFGVIYYSHIIQKKNLKILARNSILMDADDEIRALCKKIIEIDPDACPLLDGSASKLLKADPEKLKSILKAHLRQLQQA